MLERYKECKQCDMQKLAKEAKYDRFEMLLEMA